MNAELHPAQLHILDSLRRAPASSFSNLMKPLGMQSDAFKFHLRKVCNLGLVQKKTDGSYGLTTKGKEFTNTLSRSTKTVRKQPKLSMLLVVSRARAGGEIEYLCQQRKRQPYYGFWGILSGPVLWGEAYQIAAERELYKQTGLTATFQPTLFYRQRDFNKADASVLEDKLFMVLEAKNLRGTLVNTWNSGWNEWLTLQELEEKPHYFQNLHKITKAQAASQNYLSLDIYYEPTVY